MNVAGSRAGALAWLVVVPVLLGLAGVSAPAQDAEYRSRLSSITREIERLDAERRRLAAEERGVLGRIETLGAEARLLDARLEKLGIESARAEASLGEIGVRMEESRARLDEGRRALTATVRVLHRLGPLGTVRPLLGEGSAERIASGLRLVAEMSGRHRQSVEAVRAEMVRLDVLAREQEAAASERDALVARVAEERTRLEQTLRRRRAALAALRTERSARERALVELERARGELAEIVAGTRDGAGWTPGLDVTAFRGLLPMPVSGKIVRSFGVRRDPRLGTTIPHPGWDVEAAFGARVRAPFDGRVVWTGWLRGYGLVVVVDHGAGVHSVYAHLSVVLVEKEQPVTRGQVLARVGDTGSLSGPHLYFEMREEGRAVDPARWIDRDQAP